MTAHPSTRETGRSLATSSGVLSRRTAPAVLAGSLAVAVAFFAAVGFNWYGVGLLAFLLNACAIYVLSRRVVLRDID